MVSTILAQAAGGGGRRHVHLRGSGGGRPAEQALSQDPLEDSVKKWQKSFFYVKNTNPTMDCINLPPLVNAPPSEKLNRGHNPRSPSVEIVNIYGRIQGMMDREGIVPADLIAAFIPRRVLPLQRRPHRICDISGRHDPCRMSTKGLSPIGIVQCVNNISSVGLSETAWRFGMEPYD